MKKVVIGIFLGLLLSVAMGLPVNADSDRQEIVIDGRSYDMVSFSDRVIECTETKITTAELLSHDGQKVSFAYDCYNRRILKECGDHSIKYDYRDGFLVKETRSDGIELEFVYADDRLIGFEYDGLFYSYVFKDDIIEEIICDNIPICQYEYDEYGIIKAIEEYDEGKWTVSEDNGKSVGNINPIRFTSLYYDVETGMYLFQGGGYYSPERREYFGEETSLNMKKLWGDRYEELQDKYPDGLSSFDQGQVRGTLDLSYAAANAYQTGLPYYTGAYSGSEWYTSFSGSNYYYLLARIVYAEQSLTSSDSGRATALRNNRQGIGWVIINRFYEDNYRYNHNKGLTFCLTSVPSYYAVLTKDGAFGSLNSTNAKSAKSTANVAYQQAFWVAACVSVSNSFNDINSVLYHPTGVTYQCYNKGGLSSNSHPASNWNNVYFPGYSTNYTGANNYSAFPYYQYIDNYNVLHSYSTETIYINGVYY